MRFVDTHAVGVPGIGKTQVGYVGLGVCWADLTARHASTAQPVACLSGAAVMQAVRVVWPCSMHPASCTRTTCRMQLAVNTQYPKELGGLGAKALYIGEPGNAVQCW